jgi:hypothetical protein
MPATGSPPRVIVTYAHDTAQHKQRVLELGDRLRTDGVDAELDQYDPHPKSGWPKWMEQKFEAADFVLCVPSPLYLERFQQADGSKASGSRYEGVLVSTRLFREGCSYDKFAVVIFGEEHTAFIPPILQPCTYYDVSTDAGYDGLYRFLTGQPLIAKPIL